MPTLSRDELTAVSGGQDVIVVTGQRFPENPYVTPEDAALRGMTLQEYIFGAQSGMISCSGFGGGSALTDEPPCVEDYENWRKQVAENERDLQWWLTNVATSGGHYEGGQVNEDAAQRAFAQCAADNHGYDE